MSKLYIISPPRISLPEFVPQLEEALSAGDVAAFQLRLKDADDADIISAGEALIPICHKYNTIFIMNDRADLAKQLGADGLHLGDEDMPLLEAREIVGNDIVIGISCYGSTHRAMEAGEQGADYVAFGQFYETKTKPPKGRPEPDLLEGWSAYTNVPCVAIGGITPDNAKPLVDAGADFIAVVSAIWQDPEGAGSAVKKFIKALK